MPYIFDPVSYAYIWYEEGQEPPQVGSGTDVIPGYSDYYYNANPNQPASQQQTAYAQSQANATVVNMDAPGYGQNTQPAVYNTSSTSTTSADQNAQNNAYEYLKRVFEGYGLGTLAPKILEYIQKGYDTDTIALMLQDTSEYKTRFKANDARRAAGVSVLSPAEYIALERQYRQLLSTAGLPEGFFDSHDDFTSWISGDVSPAEIQERVTMASQAIYSSDQNYVATLRSYGLGDGDLVAYMLDSKRALPLLQKTVRAAQIGAEASRNALGLNQARAEQFADLGVTQDQARSAYQTIGEILPTAEKLGRIHGESLGQSDLEDEMLGGSGLASAKRKRIAMKEASQFSGSSGVGSKALSGRTRSEY
ncbi:hypothetical protein [Herbidospora cretacea]|uniref:hypothetical protein n=1 Tax=Herbidospora cretacea TaxID=28444 RepID=UPI000773D8EB|nr:hypothetical protein [Herbidospora cretacea]